MREYTWNEPRIAHTAKNRSTDSYYNKLKEKEEDQKKV